MIKIDPAVSFELERAVKFLVAEYSKGGHNPKPVIMHSLRIAVYLLEAGYAVEIVTAALLHDLIEDADIAATTIKDEFGAQVAAIVEAVSFNPGINDPEQNYREMFERVKGTGVDALIVKCADLLNNSYYYDLSPADKQASLVKKLKYFLDLSQPLIGSESVWLELSDQAKKFE